MTNIDKAKKLITAINDIHGQFSLDYFETGKIEKINLSKTTVPTEHILHYRLVLHESINDYLMTKILHDTVFYYRVKTSESILDKIQRFAGNTSQYPVNNWMNDIFGARMLLNGAEMARIQTHLDDWKTEFGLKNWYFRDQDGYRGLHIYFKNKSNFYFPWELQLWDEADIVTNVKAHQQHKRNFTNLPNKFFSHQTRDPITLKI